MKFQSLKSKWLKTRNFILNRDLLLAITISVGVIALALFLGWYNNRVVPISPSSLAHYKLEPHNPLRFMSNWDGPDYLNLAKHGYINLSQTNFFPLYPLLVHAVNWIVNSTLVSALIVSWAGFIGSVYFYLKIVKKIFSIKKNSEAIRGVLLFVLFPTAVFLLATYTESLLAALALGAIYYALQRKYIPSALLALLATASHLTGIFVVFLIAMILLEQGEKISKVLLNAVVGGLGLLSFMVFLSAKFKRPFAFLSSQKAHGWFQPHYFSHISSSFSVLNLFFLILLLASVIYWWQRKKSFSIYSLTFLLIPLVGGQFGGFDRYVLMAFPIQFMLYDYFRDKSVAYSLVIALSAIVWTYTLLQYAGGYTGA